MKVKEVQTRKNGHKHTLTIVALTCVTHIVCSFRCFPKGRFHVNLYFILIEISTARVHKEQMELV